MGSLTWYVARGSGITAYLLLTASVVLGIALSRRWYSRALPRLVVDGAHRWLTIGFYTFVVVHIVTLLLDPFTKFHLSDLLIPFASDYRPIWTSLGIIAAELGLALGLSVFIRRWIGYRAWHILHGLTYLLFPMSLLHSLGTGTDTRTLWATLLYAGSAFLVLGTLAWRVADEPRWRGPVFAAGTALSIAILIWSLGGPYASGWARASGTPERLLDSADATPAASTAPAAAGPSLPGNLRDTVTGQVLLSDDRLQVLLRGSGTGTLPLDVAIQLDNQNVEGPGQIQLRTGNGVPLCSGTVINSRTLTMTASCSGYGHNYDLQIALQQLDIRGFNGVLSVTHSQ